MNARTPTILTEQDELDRMARNRASPKRRMGSLAYPSPPPLDAMERQAFRVATLARNLQDARDFLDRSKVQLRLSPGKVVREQRRRVVMRAQRAVTAAEVALKAEQRDAEAADAVLRTDQVMPGAGYEGADLVLREASVVVTERGRPEKVTALDRLKRVGSIDARQHAAGCRYRDAYEAAGLDLYPIGLGGDGGRSAPQSGNRRIEQAVCDSRMLTKMRAVLGPPGLNLLEHVVIHNLDVRGWALRQVSATRTGLDPSVAIGRLQMALDVLAEIE